MGKKGFFLTLFMIFFNLVLLRFLEIIHWSWWWIVTFPLWGTYVLFLINFCLLVVMAYRHPTEQ